MRADPAYGFALRKVTEGKVTANELLELAAKKRGEKKEGKP
jgi:hypothetical protein